MSASGSTELSRVRRHRPSGLLVGVTLVVPLAALAGVVQTFALPAEARTHETWYGYRQEIRYDFRAEVRPGTIYSARELGPEQLVQNKLPVEPPQFRRVLVGKLTDRLWLTMPYTFQSDRPADLKVSYRMEARLATPLWQRPFPIEVGETVRLHGTRVTLGQKPIEIPVRQMINSIEDIVKDIGMGQELVELHLQPVVEVEALGLAQPVRTGLAPEFTVAIRGGGLSVDVDDRRVVKDEKTLQTTRVEPRFIRIWQWDVPVSVLREVSVSGLGSLLLIMAVVWTIRTRRQRAEAGSDLERLGPHLVHARAFELGAEVALVDVGSLKELLALQAQSERPVIRTGNTCYLVDGTSCYRLTLSGTGGDD